MTFVGRGRGAPGAGPKCLFSKGLRSPRRFPAAIRPRPPPPVASRPPRPVPLPRGPPSAAPPAARPRAGGCPRGPCRPVAARSRRPPARDAPAAGRGPCGPVAGRSAGRSIPARRSPPGERTKKPPAPGRGRGQDRRRRDRAGVHSPFPARASAPFAVANSAHFVTASGFSSIHARRYAHSAGSPEIPRVGWCRPCASFQKRLL